MASSKKETVSPLIDPNKALAELEGVQTEYIFISKINFHKWWWPFVEKINNLINQNNRLIDNIDMLEKVVRRQADALERKVSK